MKAADLQSSITRLAPSANRHTLILFISVFFLISVTFC
jgi:hypothetical protein